MSAAARARLALPLLFVLALGSACSSTSTCSRDPDSLTVEESDGFKVDGAWYSAKPIDGPYQYFPPARTIYFKPGLGKLPLFQVNLAFSSHGQFAAAAGNQAVVLCADEDTVAVLNDTCAEFYIDFVAWTAGPSSAAGGAAGADEAGGAGGSVPMAAGGSHTASGGCAAR